MTPVRMAARFGHVKVLEELIGLEADVTCRGKDEENCLHLAAGNGHLAACQEIIDVLDIEEQSLDGSTALHLAAKGGHHQVVYFLVNEGADPDIEMPNGDKAFHLAVKAGRIQVLQTLLNHDVDINCPGEDGQTPLEQATSQGLLPMVDFLVDNGATQKT